MIVQNRRFRKAETDSQTTEFSLKVLNPVESGNKVNICVYLSLNLCL